MVFSADSTLHPFCGKACVCVCSCCGFYGALAFELARIHGGSHGNGGESVVSVCLCMFVHVSVASHGFPGVDLLSYSTQVALYARSNIYILSALV